MPYRLVCSSDRPHRYHSSADSRDSQAHRNDYRDNRSIVPGTMAFAACTDRMYRRIDDIQPMIRTHMVEEVVAKVVPAYRACHRQYTDCKDSMEQLIIFVFDFKQINFILLLVVVIHVIFVWVTFAIVFGVR